MIEVTKIWERKFKRKYINLFQTIKFIEGISHFGIEFSFVNLGFW